jgi:Zn-dependent peptidase ImmA (M78 family)
MGVVVVRVPVQPELLDWAQRRSGVAPDELAEKFPKLAEWHTGTRQPTLNQLEQFSRATHTPVGMLLLSEPPEVPLPIPDFRTMGGQGVVAPTPNLLEVIFLCQQRQEWYQSFARANREGPVSFVGTLDVSDDVSQAAETIRHALTFHVADRGPTWSEALRRLVENTESLGVLVMVSGIVGSNTHRKLDPNEFRGFALVDSLAPVIFINGSDTKAAQIFTLAHELAHLWIGQSGLDDADMASRPTGAVERWCNQVAAEILVPLSSVIDEFNSVQPLTEELERLAGRFKVSTLVVLRRLFDGGQFQWDEYWSAYRSELQRVLALRESAGSGGNFYNTQPVRNSKRFTRAVITSTLEGQTLYRDAFQMLGFRKQSTFDELTQHLGLV